MVCEHLANRGPLVKQVKPYLYGADSVHRSIVMLQQKRVFSNLLTQGRNGTIVFVLYVVALQYYSLETPELNHLNCCPHNFGNISKCDTQVSMYFWPYVHLYSRQMQISLKVGWSSPLNRFMVPGLKMSYFFFSRFSMYKVYQSEPQRSFMK